MFFWLLSVWVCCGFAYHQDETNYSQTKFKPTILYPMDQSNSYLVPGVDNLNLSCKAYGNPVPSMQWVLNTLPISNYSHPNHRFVIHKSVNPEGNIVTLNLTGSRSLLEENSEFICVAFNSVGLDEHTVYITSEVTSMVRNCIKLKLLIFFFFRSLQLL